ncbi:type II secretion system protein F (GspF) [Hazenella coriacea]|uniref:Type II secretion system protein F (GspF) n=1 Tax=Hazenella coriacea TaxID=1179467 RepID=A0A4R3L6L0_9BACL|nr:type II secretion system protein F (GspF) [Hazenella coriacea]
MVLFSQQLGNLLASGIPLLESIQLLIDQQLIAKQQGECLIHMIQQGSSFSEALEKIQLPYLCISLMRASEEYGNYAQGLKQCEQYYESKAKLYRELVQASLYPAIVLILVGIAFVFMITVVLPNFSELYTVMGIELPLVTQGLIIAYSYLRILVFWVFIVFVLFLIFVILIRKSSKEMRAHWEKRLFYLPWIKKIYRYRFTHFYSLQLGSLLQAGIPLLSSLNLIERTAPWASLNKSIQHTKEQLMKGMPLYTAIQSKPDIFLPTLTKMIALGEQSGRLDESLLSLAKSIEWMMRRKAEQWTRSLEPILIFVIGVWIAITVISMFLPLLQLVKAI